MNPNRFSIPQVCSPKTLMRIGLTCLGLACVLWASGCATVQTPVLIDPTAQAEKPTLESTYGIKVDGLRLTAAGSMLDFRYRVLDPKKAAVILDGKFQPYLLDEVRSAKLGVPDTPVLGRIRQTSRNNKVLMDRTYFIMFGNPGKAVQSGDRVTLLLGQVKITDLMVQ